MTGTDISGQSLRRAAQTASKLSVSLKTIIGDFRDLSGVDGTFDVVISCDNGIPHLLNDDDVDIALGQMYSKLRPGGLLVISTRDYGRALAERPRSAAPLDMSGPPRRILVRLHEWDAPESPLYTVRFLIMTRGETNWTVTEHATRYRALPSDQLAETAIRAGYQDVDWLSADESQFHQPVMIAQRPL